jgi:hypothetical protein
MAPFKSSFFILPLLIGLSSPIHSQSVSDKASQTKNLIESKKYIFEATSARSSSGRNVQLTPGYSIKLINDSLSVDLPYYGRAYTSSYPGSDLSIVFNTTQFGYVTDSTKKQGWEITISPKNQSKADKIYLSVSSDGYCSVRVSCSSRQPISYYGNIYPLGQ